MCLICLSFILGVTLDSKMTFEQQFMNVTSSVARSMGIVRRASKVFGTENVLTTCLRSYCLSRLEYCASSWCSAATTYLGLLDIFVRRGERHCKKENLLILESTRLQLNSTSLWASYIHCITQRSIGGFPTAVEYVIKGLWRQRRKIHDIEDNFPPLPKKRVTTV